MEFGSIAGESARVLFWLIGTSAALIFIAARTADEMKAAKEKDDRNFTVRVPRIFIIVLLIYTLFFSGCAVLALVQGIVKHGSPDSDGAAMMLLFAFPGFIGTVGFFLRKVQVDGESISRTSFIGIRRSITRAQIDHVCAPPVSEHDTIIVYACGKRFCAVTREYDCYENFERWLKDEGLKIEPPIDGITKRLLLRIALPYRELNLFFAIGANVIIAGMIVYDLITRALIGLHDPATALALFALIEIVGCLPLLITVLIRCPLLIRVAVQERALGASLAQETKGVAVDDDLLCKDGVWFVSFRSGQVFAYRRGWVTSARDDGEGLIDITLADGRTRQMSMEPFYAAIFVKWVNEGR